MALLTTVLTWIYVLSAVSLSAFAAGSFVLLLLWLIHARRASLSLACDSADLPTVTVQLPVYNERMVIARLIEAAAALDYPPDRLCIQILDDSTDDTADVIAQTVARLRRVGAPCLVHVRRGSREDYKAGALAFGLAQTDADFIAVFDADFIPPPDFLQRVMPHFAQDAALGMVQTRWGHLNPFENLLTRAQVLSLDGHFGVEQTARSRGGLLLNFSGSGGVWRSDCIRDAGGWSGATLCEDLDLSYRAQLAGWRLRYLPGVVVPAELPPQLAAYKQQQARWAKGSTQNLLRLGGRLWGSRRLSFWQKLLGTLHLGQYLAQPLMLLLLLLTPPVAWLGGLEHLPLASLGIAGIGPPLLFLAAQISLYRDWPRRVLAFPVLVAVGTGLSLSNTLAVLSALRGAPNVFRRTPKFRGSVWQRSRYAQPVDSTLAGEVLLALYALGGGVMLIQAGSSLAVFLFVYAYAFGVVAAWGLLEGLLLWRDARVLPRVHSDEGAL